jgi:hypothetical protein
MSDTTRDRDLEVLKRAWALSPALHQLPSGAPEKALKAVEKRLGVPLPGDLRALYRVSDGPSLFLGNLNIYPSDARREITLGRAADVFRARGWPVPDEILVFADDGAGSLYGIWTGEVADPRFPAPPSPVVEIIESEEPEALGLAATSLVRFLVFQTALGALQAGGAEEVLAALDVPEYLRRMDPGDPDLERLREWADPDLPRKVSDPYLGALDPEELRQILAGELRDRAEPTVH